MPVGGGVAGGGGKVSASVNPETEVVRLLREHGAILTRTKRHFVYKFPNGRTFTMACTPSDYRAASNQLRQLKRTLGLFGVRGVPGDRREKVDKPGRTANLRISASVDPVMLEAMRKAGLVEARLNDKIAALTLQLRDSRAANHRKKRQLRQLQSRKVTCWACRLRNWWRRWNPRTEVTLEPAA